MNGRLGLVAAAFVVIATISIGAAAGAAPAHVPSRSRASVLPGASGGCRFCAAHPVRPSVRRAAGARDTVGRCRGGCTFAMDPGTSGGFLSMPWPNDIRRHEDGSIDLDGFPGSDTNPIVGLVLGRGAQSTTGFGTNSAIYFQSAAAVSPGSLPTGEESLERKASLMLVDLDAGEPAQHPVLSDFRDSPTAYRPGNLLSILPYPGHPLREDTRYAAILFGGLSKPDGAAMRRSPLIDDLGGGWDDSRPVDAEAWAALRAQRGDVFDYVERYTAWRADDVVAFTVFTTQNVTGEMRAIAAAIEALPAPTPVWNYEGDCSQADGPTTNFFGTLRLPKWQAGTPPFDEGGAIVLEGGRAVRQSSETVDLVVSLPCGDPPDGGWPILLFMDGTGASASAYIPYFGYPHGPLPFVLGVIAPLYSGDRSRIPGVSGSELDFFNYVNPLAGRTNQLQQAADMIYLRRAVEGLVFTAEEAAASGPVETNDERIAIAGHSQGALTIPQVLAVDPSFKAAFLSSGGGGLYQTLLHRGDTRTFVESLLQAPGELDMFHPLVHGLQTIAEIGDAVNYGHPAGSPHVVSVGGLIDGCSPLEVVSMLGTAMGLETAHPLYVPVFGSSLLEPPTVELPAGGNLADGRTGLTVQLDTGHFGSVTNPRLGGSFLESFAEGRTPLVDPGSLMRDDLAGCAGRFAPLPTDGP